MSNEFSPDDAGYQQSLTNFAFPWIGAAIILAVAVKCAGRKRSKYSLVPSSLTRHRSSPNFLSISQSQTINYCQLFHRTRTSSFLLSSLPNPLSVSLSFPLAISLATSLNLSISNVEHNIALGTEVAHTAPSPCTRTHAEAALLRCAGCRSIFGCQPHPLPPRPFLPRERRKNIHNP